jgi:hypothetical protein
MLQREKGVVDSRTYEAIRERHSFDFELYFHALAKFRRQESA